MNEQQHFDLGFCPVTVGEKWADGYLVHYPVSYTYNGGIVVDGQWYAGIHVPSPNIPEGFALVGIGVGLQLNARPPYATMLLKAEGSSVSGKEMQRLLREKEDPCVFLPAESDTSNNYPGDGSCFLKRSLNGWRNERPSRNQS